MIRLLLAALLLPPPAMAQDITTTGLITQTHTMDAGHGAASTATITAPGSGTNGPSNAQIGYSINLKKSNWWSGPWTSGELDGIYVTVRQGGNNSDASGILIDVQNEGQSFLSAAEMVSNIVNPATNTLTYGIDLQQGVLNALTGDYIGGVVSATHGALATGYLVQASAGASWANPFLARDGTGAAYFGVDGTGNIFGRSIRIVQTTPSHTAACSAGTITADANYVYVCTATNSWKRAALSAY